MLTVFSLVVSAAVTLAATLNVTLGVSAPLCLYSVVASLGYMFHALDVQLAQSEVISLLFGVGLSVHHIMAFVMDFHGQPLRLRSRKVQQTYKNMGVSAIAACICQIGAGGILYGTELTILQRTCYVLVCSGMVSLLSITLLFGALMHICGPQFGHGDIFCCCQAQHHAEVDSEGYMYD